jgi:nicotinate phosphoribosyltransferase
LFNFLYLKIKLNFKLKKKCFKNGTQEEVDLAELSLKYLKDLEGLKLKFLESECNKGELAAFISFAIAFPTNFLALVDTYDVLK